MSDATGAGEQKQFELDLSKVGMLIIVPVGLWAYYTTFRGMVLLTGGERAGQFEIIGTIGALIGAAAILIMMALTSWLLGADLAASFANQRRPDGSTKRNLLLMICTFLFFFSLSVFFSYTYYHHNFFELTSKGHVAVEHPAQMHAAIMGPLRETLKKNDDAESERIRKSDTTWSDSLAELIRVSGKSRKEIEKAVEEVRGRIAKENAGILGKAKAAEGLLKKNRERRAELDREIERLNTSMKPDLDQIKQLNDEAAEHDAEADRAATGLDKTKVAKCGPNCQGERKKAAQARAQAKKYEAALAPRRKELAGYEKEATKLDQEIVDLQKQIDEAKRVVPLASLDEVSGNYLTAILQALQAAYNRPTPENISTARQHCERLLEILRETKFATKVAGDFNCVPTNQETLTLLAARTKVLAARQAFEKQCGEAPLARTMAAISGEVQAKKIQPAESLPRARKDIEACITQAVPAGLTAAQEAQYFSEVARFARDNQIDINQFDRAMNSARKMDGDFRMAISIAFAQDMLILVFKFVADNYKYRSRRRRRTEIVRPVDLADRETDDPDIRAWKALLRLARPGASDTSRLMESDINSQGFDADVLANIYGTLNNLGRQGAAWTERKGTFVIDNSAIHAIEQELRAADGPAGSTDGDRSADSSDRPSDDRDRPFGQSGDGYRRNLSGASGQPAAQAAPEPRPSSRSARRGRLREFLTESQEPRSDRSPPSRQDKAPRMRASEAASKPTSLEPLEPTNREPTNRDQPPSDPPAPSQPKNAFDYLSRFSQSNSPKKDN